MEGHRLSLINDKFYLFEKARSNKRIKLMKFCGEIKQYLRQNVYRVIDLKVSVYQKVWYVNLITWVFLKSWLLVSRAIT